LVVLGKKTTITTALTWYLGCELRISGLWTTALTWYLGCGCHFWNRTLPAVESPSLYTWGREARTDRESDMLESHQLHALLACQAHNWKKKSGYVLLKTCSLKVLIMQTTVAYC